MKLLGLIGYPLSHSFSKKYFTEKFAREGLSGGWQYDLFPLENIAELPDLLRGRPNLVGLNVTIPYKTQVIPYLNALNDEAAAIGAVNCIRIQNGTLMGFNTDVYGFELPLINYLNKNTKTLSALILGNGGAAKAVKYVLQKYRIPYQVVSRKASPDTDLTYDALTIAHIEAAKLIINTTPLGMSPNTEGVPPLPFEGVGAAHLLYDLVYNPTETTFLRLGKERGAAILNGLPMLYGQADRSWEIWQEMFDTKKLLKIHF